MAEEQLFSKYIVYADESGDHGMVAVDAQYPIFVLAFCIFEKDAYMQQVCPALQAFKFKYFGHDGVILHEHGIRKLEGPFRILFDRVRREKFLEELSAIIAKLPFVLVAIAIRKEKLKAKYTEPQNPYDLSLIYGLERIVGFLNENAEAGSLTHVVFERRGKKEDEELELVFRRVCDAQKWPLEIQFALKTENRSGLQVADLVARPIGRHVIAPSQANRAFETLEPKFRRVKERYEGPGLKVFP